MALYHLVNACRDIPIGFRLVQLANCFGTVLEARYKLERRIVERGGGAEATQERAPAQPLVPNLGLLLIFPGETEQTRAIRQIAQKHLSHGVIVGLIVKTSFATRE